MRKSFWFLAVFALLSVTMLAAVNVNLDSFVFSDSSFDLYTPEVTNDGELNDDDPDIEGRWGEVAWASADTPDEHWLEYELAGKADIDSIYIWWARDSGRFMYSEEFMIEINGKVVYDSVLSKNPLVKEVINLEGDALGYQVTKVYFNEPINGYLVRIIQPPGGGNIERPNIMWVAEVEIWEN